jgi:hypothetical protein
MLQKLLCSLCVLVVCTGTLLAAEYRGKVMAVDTDKGKITITGLAATAKTAVKDFETSNDTKFLDAGGKDLADGIKNAMLKGSAVVVTYEEKDGKNIAKTVQLIGK